MAEKSLDDNNLEKDFIRPMSISGVEVNLEEVEPETTIEDELLFQEELKRITDNEN